MFGPDAAFTALSHRGLVELSVRLQNLAAGEVEALIRADLPQLKVLRLNIPDALAEDVVSLGRLFAGDGLPRLTTLELDLGQRRTSLPILLASALLRRIDLLVLTGGGELDIIDAEVLVAAAHALPELRLDASAVTRDIAVRGELRFGFGHRLIEPTV